MTATTAERNTHPMTTVHVLDELTDPLIGPAYTMYERAFRPQAHLAANRHLMTSTEFLAVCADRKIEKHLVMADDGRIAGFGAITRHLDRVPLIEPAYFAHHYADDVAAGRAWYVIFAATDRSPGTLSDLLLSMSDQARCAGGAVFMDFSAHNVRRQLPRVAERLLAAHSWSLTTRETDAQRFWAFEFSTADQPLRPVQ